MSLARLSLQRVLLFFVVGVIVRRLAAIGGVLLDVTSGVGISMLALNIDYSGKKYLIRDGDFSRLTPDTVTWSACPCRPRPEELA